MLPQGNTYLQRAMHSALPHVDAQKNLLAPCSSALPLEIVAIMLVGCCPITASPRSPSEHPAPRGQNVPKHHCSHSQCVFTFGFCRQGQGKGNVPERPHLSVIKTRPQATTSRIYEDANIKRHRHQQRRLTAAEQRPVASFTHQT